MKRRHLYTLLFAIPGFFIALGAAFFLVGAGAGFLWLFIYGDNTWPPLAARALPVLFILAFSLFWLTAILLGYRTGRALEAQTHFNRRHFWISVGATLLPLALILIQQYGTGNIGLKSEGQLCSEFCIEKGFFGSGTPPKTESDRTCSCYDAQGNEVIKMPLEEVATKQAW